MIACHRGYLQAISNVYVPLFHRLVPCQWGRSFFETACRKKGLKNKKTGSTRGYAGDFANIILKIKF
jgi:hypothetical protein